MAPVPGADADLLEAAAWLHDIAYAPGLTVTGLHALDSARYRRDARTPTAAGVTQMRDQLAPRLQLRIMR